MHPRRIHLKRQDLSTLSTHPGPLTLRFSVLVCPLVLVEMHHCAYPSCQCARSAFCGHCSSWIHFTESPDARIRVEVRIRIMPH